MLDETEVGGGDHPFAKRAGQILKELAADPDSHPEIAKVDRGSLEAIERTLSMLNFSAQKANRKGVPDPLTARGEVRIPKGREGDPKAVEEAKSLANWQAKLARETPPAPKPKQVPVARTGR